MLKRMNFFKGQLLRVKDFKDEQTYHMEMMRLHHKNLHTWGIIEGLQLSSIGNSITVGQGSAISPEGKLINLYKEKNFPKDEFRDKNFVVISFFEEPTDEVEETGIKGNSRVLDSAKVSIVSIPERETHLILGKVIIGESVEIDLSERRNTGLSLTTEVGEKIYITAKIFDNKKSGILFEANTSEFNGSLITKNLKVAGDTILGSKDSNQVICNGVLHPRIKPNKPLPKNTYHGRKLQIAGDIEFQEILSTPAGMIVTAKNDISLIAESGVYIKASDNKALSGHLIVEKDLRVLGSINAKTKQFVIDHPLAVDKNLQHSSLEGPEIAVYYRGEDTVTDGQKTVCLPDYFEALTRQENRTVLITPKWEQDKPISHLAASAVTNGKFTVKAVDNQNPEQSFYWEVKAVRADVELLDVEKEKERAEKTTHYVSC